MSTGSDVIRRSANYHPSIWGDRFLNLDSQHKIYGGGRLQEIEELKKEVRRELLDNAADSLSQLKLIDGIQRLGVGYQFEQEIEEALHRLYEKTDHDLLRDRDDDDDLYHVALRFRLLRQHGYKVSCDIFSKFKDGEGSFKETVKADVPGMLSLYEAAHIGGHGEDILDEAIAFTTAHLRSVPEPPVVVTHALRQPLHRGVPRLEARRYITFYQHHQPLPNKALLKLATLDFNVVQSLHKEELGEISRWWTSLNFATKLPFARDRVVECYFWIVGVYSEPQYSLARKLLTKVISMTSIIDDIYDVYGLPQELDLFTAAIDRWDVSCADKLPEYMQTFYVALLDLYKEIEKELWTKGWAYRVHHAKEEMKILVRAYHDESKWFHNNYTPTMEEYMRVSLVTSGYSMLTAASFLGMGDGAVTEQAFDWVRGQPKIIRASTIIGRLMDDIKSHKFEQERGHAASAVECYMKEHQGATEEEVHGVFYKQVADAWKDINEECMKPTGVAMPLLARVLNLSRVIDVIYKEGDGYTHVGKVMRDNIASVLIDPVPV